MPMAMKIPLYGFLIISKLPDVLRGGSSELLTTEHKYGHRICITASSASRNTQLKCCLWYTQIKKGLLAIVPCEHFEAYVYGCGLVNIETDHKSLEPIFLKPLASRPTRLQRMLLQVQKYSLHITYKKAPCRHIESGISPRSQCMQLH